MSTKKVNVLFKNQEKTFEIDLQENNTYELFVKKINEEFNRTNTYQLMAMNSSEPYAILNQDNYLKILNEDIPEGLKLFMSEMVKTQDTLNSILEVNKDDKKEEKEDDDDFVIEENQGNNKEENDNNIIINIEQEKVNINDNNQENNEVKEEEEKEKEIEQDDNNFDISNKFKSMVFQKSQSQQIQNLTNKINNLFDDIDENDLYKNKYILKSSITNPETFKTEKCNSCKSPLEGVKYICCICDNYIICEECELYHNHPCFKYKSKFLSNILDVSNFIEKYYGFKLPYESTGYTKLFRKEYDIKIVPLTDFNFCLRPNKKVLLPIKILNYSKEKINSSQIIILCKNQKHIYLSSNEKYNVEPGGEYILKIICLTPERTCPEENIIIEIYSHELNIKSSRRLLIKYNIEVNFDAEDDKINMELKNDEEIYCYSKEHKKLALEIMNSTNNEYKVKNVFRSLFENNWDKNNAIKALKKMK